MFALVVTQVIGVNLFLSADNAVVIALASRSLPSGLAAASRIGVPSRAKNSL